MILVKFKDGRRIKGYVTYDEGNTMPYCTNLGKPSDRMVMSRRFETFNEAIEKGFEHTGVHTFTITKGCSIAYVGGKGYVHFTNSKEVLL